MKSDEFTFLLVQADYSRPAQNVAAAGTEPYRIDRGKRSGIEKELARSDAAQLFHGGFDLIRGLRVAGRVQRRAGSGY